MDHPRRVKNWDGWSWNWHGSWYEHWEKSFIVHFKFQYIPLWYFQILSLFTSLIHSCVQKEIVIIGFDECKQFLLISFSKRFIMNTLFLDSNNLCVFETHKSFLCVMFRAYSFPNFIVARISYCTKQKFKILHKLYMSCLFIPIFIVVLFHTELNKISKILYEFLKSCIYKYIDR